MSILVVIFARALFTRYKQRLIRAKGICRRPLKSHGFLHPQRAFEAEWRVHYGEQEHRETLGAVVGCIEGEWKRSRS